MAVHLLAKNSRGNWRPRCGVKHYVTVTTTLSSATCKQCLEMQERGAFAGRSFTNVKADERRAKRPITSKVKTKGYE